jgi:hypothetical protein
MKLGLDPVRFRLVCIGRNYDPAHSIVRFAVVQRRRMAA